MIVDAVWWICQTVRTTTCVWAATSIISDGNAGKGSQNLASCAMAAVGSAKVPSVVMGGGLVRRLCR